MTEFIPNIPTSTPQLSIGIQIQDAAIQIIVLKNGHPVPDGTVAMTEEEAVQHTMGLVKAIDMLRGHGKPRLILPGLGPIV